MNSNKSKNSESLVFKLVGLRDTTLNGVTLKFTELTNSEFNSLNHQIKETQLPLEFTSNVIFQADSCLILRIDNGKIDSLCSKNQRDNFEQYNFAGFWKENGLVLISYQDWEGGNDFFVNLKDGGYYYLTHNYKTSPDLKHILSFVDLNETVFIPSGLMLTECGNKSISTRFLIEFEQVMITSLSWLTNDQCLVTAGTLNSEDFSVVNSKNYRLTLIYN